VVGTLRDGPERSTLVGQLYWVPHGLLLVFNTILYENEFQNPQIFYLDKIRSNHVITLLGSWK
jgi:hypothetical protein